MPHAPSLPPSLLPVLTATLPLLERQRELQRLLREGADANATVANEKPLTTAVRQNWGTLVWVLLAEGRADPNGCVNPDQRDHPLYRAVSNPKVPAHLLEVLIAAGAAVDVQAPGQHAQTPLHLAAQDGALDKVVSLLTMGANPLLRDDQGRRPMDLARTDAVRATLAPAEHERETLELHQDVDTVAPDVPGRSRARL